MNILLTNDDGITARGINALYDALCNDHEVFMVAPDRERSACSNAITIRSELFMKSVSDRKFSLTGFPADCTNVALHSNILPEIDLVISGINHGPNLGCDIYYSGTVAGARTAHIFGTNSIAVSLDSFDSLDYIEDTAEFIADFVRNATFEKQDKVFLNINYPSIAKNEIKGIKYSSLGKRKYQDLYEIIETNEGVSLLLDGIVNSVERLGTDVTEIKEGYITITPLHLDTTDYTALEKYNGD